MRKEKLISVIMPVHNGSNTLYKTINDVLQQTYQHFELICVNDGSTDQSGNMLNDLADYDSRIRVFHQENQGAGAARNVGLRVARGDYLLFLDCDDRFDAHLLEITVEMAERNKADIVMFDAACEDAESGQENRSDWFIRKNAFPKKEIFCYKDCKDRIFNLSYGVAWNKLYRMSFIKQLGLCFQNTPYMNDTFFDHIALVEAERIVFINKKMVTYRQDRTGAITNPNTFQKNPDCMLEVMDSIREYLTDHGFYQDVYKSFVISAVYHILPILELLKNDGYFATYDIVKDKLFAGYEIKKMKIDEFPEQWMRDYVQAMEKYSGIEFIFYLMGRYQQYSKWASSYSYTVGNELINLIKYKHWTFSANILKQGDRVILYGAGEVGTDYYIQLIRESKVEVVGWVDRGYVEISDKPIRVEAPDTIRHREFDYIIIAVRSMDKIEEIKKQLIQYNVPDEKIMLMSEGIQGMSM